MTEDATPFGSDVVLGFDAAWGFSPADQTSPALAAAAGALVDVTLDQRVTELRIHGVSGSTGPVMLEHPEALQVAGDAVTGFYRRWIPGGAGRPSVPWKLEAYSWGGLTEAPLASASWLLLAPFMMYNVAHFMLPPGVGPADAATAVAAEPTPHLRRNTGHQIAEALLRLLALAATIQFVSAAGSVVVSVVAWQAAGRAGMLPGWMGWYGAWTAGWRVALALAAVAVVVAALWWISVTTAGKYEARTSTAPPELNPLWPLTQAGFWKGKVLVRRQRALHSAAACAAAALIAALPADRPAAARWVAVALAAVVLAAAVISVAAPMADRHVVTIANDGSPEGGRADVWCRVVLVAAVVALLTTAVVSGWTDRRHGPQPGALPGLTSFLAVLLAVQVVLLIALAITVVVLAGQARAAGCYEGVPPYLRGWLTPLIAMLGFSLGGLLTVLINFGVTRILGTPVPSGFVFDTAPSNALAVPWPIYAFGAAPIGLLVGGAGAAVLLLHKYLSNCRKFADPTETGPSPVAAAYATSATAGAGTGSGGDDRTYAKNRGAIAKAWAVGLVADQAAAATAWVVGGSVIAVLVIEVAAAITAGPASHPGHLDGWLHGFASVVALLGVLAAGLLLTLLRLDYTDSTRRKTIGALWDVCTFWPRAAHPLAPPCYAERAVPEVVDRIRLLTGHLGSDPDDRARLHAEAELPNLERTQGLTMPAGPVLLTGYSQGSVIAPAVVAQLSTDVRSCVALLTLACPARRLYGRAFPTYFGGHQLDALRDFLDADAAPDDLDQPTRPGGRWKNLRRRSDYIGSFIFAEPESCLDADYLRDHIDQPCWDPVVLVPDANPTPPPTHRHSQWWQDPRTAEVSKYLVDYLVDRLDP